MTTTAHPARHGQPFTDDDHGTIIRLAQEGATSDQIGEALQRTAKSVEQRARKLLPPGMRQCPQDRAVQTLAVESTARDMTIVRSRMAGPRPWGSSGHPEGEYDPDPWPMVDRYGAARSTTYGYR